MRVKHAQLVQVGDIIRRPNEPDREVLRVTLDGVNAIIEARPIVVNSIWYYPPQQWVTVLDSHERVNGGDEEDEEDGGLDGR